MPLDVAYFRSKDFPPLHFSYGPREAIIYALCAGMGQDPGNLNELDFVYEPHLKVLPTLLTAAAWDYRFILDSTIDKVMILHGAQSVTMHAPLPASCKIVNRFRIKDLFDKGPGRGAVIVSEIELRDETTGKLLCTSVWTSYARGEGGFGGERGPSLTPQDLPGRSHDVTVPCQTQTTSSLLYRLLGDDNPLHADPAFSAAAGFDRPILHGLCTYAVACRAVAAGACGYDPARLRQLDCQFIAPAFPGETIDTLIWLDGATATFQCRSRERDCELARGQAAIAAAGDSWSALAAEAIPAM
jgi:acyl dehydratase